MDEQEIRAGLLLHPYPECHWLAEHGRLWTVGEWPDEAERATGGRRRRFARGQCWQNAFRLYGDAGGPLRYVEGITIVTAGPPVATWHGWTVTEAGHVADPTCAFRRAIPPFVLYFGVAYEPKAAVPERFLPLFRERLGETSPPQFDL